MTISKDQEERAKRLNAAIVASGLSYEELYKLTGIPSSSLQRYASGATKKIPIDYLIILAEVLKIDAETLIWGEKEALPDERSATVEIVKNMSESEFDRLNTVIKAMYPDKFDK